MAPSSDRDNAGDTRRIKKRSILKNTTINVSDYKKKGSPKIRTPCNT